MPLLGPAVLKSSFSAASVGERGEPRLVQHLVAQTSVETFDEGVQGWLAKCDGSAVRPGSPVTSAGSPRWRAPPHSWKRS